MSDRKRKPAVPGDAGSGVATPEATHSRSFEAVRQRELERLRQERLRNTAPGAAATGEPGPRAPEVLFDRLPARPLVPVQTPEEQRFMALQRLMSLLGL